MNPTAKGGYNTWTTAGFFGRLNYDYKGRYLLEANIRYDGSSRFLRENRWNWFPSFSAGWNIAQEAFWENLAQTVNTLKLRASWGELGNQNTEGWNIAQEAFWENLAQTVNTLKLRASWGELGNQNTDNWYPFYPTMTYKTNNGNWLVNNAKPNTAEQAPLVSALLTWERSRTWEIGLLPHHDLQNE